MWSNDSRECVCTHHFGMETQDSLSAMFEKYVAVSFVFIRDLIASAD